MNDINEQGSFETKCVTIMLKLVGTACNMHCHYCYEHVSNVKHSGSNDIEKIIQYLSQYKNYEHVFIVFHGGEPLLMSKSVMKELLKYIYESFTGKWQVQIQTNGTLLEDEWIGIFEKFLPNLSLSISLDPLGKKDLRFGNDRLEREKLMQRLEKYVKCIPNIGVISVAHAYNKDDFVPFIIQLRKCGIASLTINKYQANTFESKYFITEKEYVLLLKEIFGEWIRNKWYSDLNIQPLMALFSKNANKICTYLPDEKKCTYFRTYYNENDKYDCCDHLTAQGIQPIEAKCFNCEIFSKCGGGCLAEKKDSSFCEARMDLFEYIEEVRNGSK